MPDSSRSLASRRPWWVLHAGLAVALVLVLWRWFDLDQAIETLAQVDPLSGLLFFVLMAGTRVQVAWRWLTIAQHHMRLERLSLGFLVRVQLLSEFCGIWLQSTLGAEAVRIWKVVGRTGDKLRGPGSVVLDRLVGTICLLAVSLPFVGLFGASLDAPLQRLQSALDGGVWIWLVAAILTVGLALGLWVTVRLARHLRRAWSRAIEFAGRSRLLFGPFLISLSIYAVMIVAFKLAIPELAAGSWATAASIVVLPRLGWAVPLSVFGVSAVEGTTVLVGSLLGLSTETVLLIVGLNLAVKYAISTLGVVLELATHGTAFLRAAEDGRDAAPEAS